MVQRLGSPLISTATLRMTAILGLGVTAIMAGPSIYAQFAPKVEAIATGDDDRGIWKLPPPPRYLIENAKTSTDDATASLPKQPLVTPVATPVTRTVLMNPQATAPTPALPVPPAPPAAAVASLAHDTPIPAPVVAPLAVPATPSPAAQTMAPKPVTAPKSLAAKPAAVPPPVKTAALPPDHAAKPAVVRPGAPKLAAPAPAPMARPAASKSAKTLTAPTLTGPAKPAAAKPKPALVAQAKPVTTTASVPAQPNAVEPPPQSQRIPVISSILDGINSAGQAITNAVPKF